MSRFGNGGVILGAGGVVSGLATTTESTTAKEVEDFGFFWWLVLPVVVVLALLAISLAAPQFYAVYIESEQGLLELSHIAIPLTACWLALRGTRMPEIKGRHWLTAWFGILALGCFYIGGEEASWGQQIFFWTTPEGWSQLNDQNETNLHNMSSWLDQKPRLLVELGVLVGGIIVPVAALFRPALRSGKLALFLPPLLCLPSAVIAEISRLPERIGPALGLGNGPFPRASEVQELYFYLFILFYVIVLKRRLRHSA